jgi:hypothetical protein
MQKSFKPLYGNALNRTASLGVGDGGRECVGVLVFDEGGGGASVVFRELRFVVSDEGGGGRGVIVEARQRKHSPLPKYVCVG